MSQEEKQNIANQIYNIEIQGLKNPEEIEKLVKNVSSLNDLLEIDELVLDKIQATLKDPNLTI